MRFIFIAFLLLVGCTSTDEEYTQNSLDATMPKGITYYLNGEQFNDLYILPGDTLEIKFLLEANCNMEARLDYITIKVEDWYEGHNGEIAKIKDAIYTHEYYNESFQKEFSREMSYQIIIPEYDTDRLDYANGTSLSLKVSAKFNDDSDEIYLRDGVDFKGLVYENKRIYVNNGGLNYSFRLYNNYIGKPLDDTTGLGFNIFTALYTNNLCELDSACQGSINSFDRSTLLSLTYMPEVNQTSETFVPAFGYLEDKIISFQKFEAYNWDRNFNYGDSEVIEVGNIVENPLIGDVYKLTYHVRGSYYKGFLKVVDIFEKEVGGYVEFEVYIDNRELKRFF